MKGTGMKAKSNKVGNMMEFRNCATWVRSLATSGANTTVVEKASQVQKAKCFLWCYESKPVVTE
jgi:hypothetical protein